MAKEFVRSRTPKGNEDLKLQELVQQAQRTRQLYRRTLGQVRRAKAALNQERQLVIRSEHRFRSLIDALPQGIFMKDSDLIYVACNVAHARALGLASPKEIIGRRDEDIFPTKLAHKYKTDDRRVIDGGKTIDVEETGVLDGKEASVQTVKTPMRDEHGHITGVLGIYWDISKRKQAERALEISEKRYRNLVESSPAIIYEYSLKHGGIYYSPQVAEILGYPLDQFYADPFLWNRSIHPDDAANIAKSLKGIRSGSAFDLEYRIRNAQGNWQWLDDRSIGVREESGDIIVTGLAVDITERKVHEMLLQARLRLNDMAPKLDHRQLMQATLDIAEELTGGNIGFFHFVDEDQETILLQAWSTHTVERMCTAEGADMHYPVSQAGVWADAIRSGKPVIHNDYAALPDKKGMPEGHAAVSGLVTVPILRHDKVVAAIGIGNKPQPYDGHDVDILLQLADFAWDVIEVKKAEEALRLSEETYHSLFDHMLNGLAHCQIIVENGKPVDFIYLSVNDNFEKLTGLKDVVGRRVSEVIPGIREEDPELIETYGRVAMGGEPQRFETYVKALDMWFWVSVYSPKKEYFVAVFDVITERKKAEIALEHANRALMTLGTVNRELVHATNEIELMRSICTAIVEQRGYRMAWVGYARNNAAKDIELMASAGVPQDLLDMIRPGWGDDARAVGPTGRAIRTGKTQIARDIAGEPPHDWKDAMLKAGCASDIALPLKDEAGTAFGLLHVYADEVDAFTDNEIRLLEEMAGDLAFGVNVLRVRLERDDALNLNEQHLALSRQNLEETVVAISKAVEARDPYTAGHQRRVAKLAVAIGRQMGLDEDALLGIHMGGTIHDIGKINIPAEILSKPFRLSEMEYMMVKEHPKVGYEILKDIHFPWPVAEVAYQHHERLDGSGYPQGLKGNEICLEARIVAVADVVEAMNSHRPYRPGLGSDAALAEIRNNRGRLYCADAVDACLQVIADGFSFS